MYRRNSDENLRSLERAYTASGAAEDLEALNIARIRAGLQAIVNLKLAFGYNPGIPPTAPAAWGARMIIERGQVNFVSGRQDIQFSDPESKLLLTNAIEEGNFVAAFRAEAMRLLNAGVISTTEAKEVILYEDDQLVVIGNTNGSHGYLYVSAFLKPFDWISKPSTCDSCGKPKIRKLLVECSSCHQLVCRDLCAAQCGHCLQYLCHQDNNRRPKCDACEDSICLSTQCEQHHPAVDCNICGRLYCYDCREEVQDCECQEEEWCEEECGEQRKECPDCGEFGCPCAPCSCDEDENEEHEEDEDEEYEEGEDEEDEEDEAYY